MIMSPVRDSLRCDGKWVTITARTQRMTLTSKPSAGPKPARR